MNEGHRFMLVKPCSYQVIAIAGGASWNKRLKRAKRLNSNSMTL